MRRVVALAAVLAFVLIPPCAQAHTTIIEPPESHNPYQWWVDEARMPTPDVTLEVFEAPYDICGGGAAACTAEYRIWFDSRYFASEPTRPAFYHEVGHNFDGELSTPLSRRQFRRITGNRRPWDQLDIAAPSEQFAEHYRRCALGVPSRTPAICGLMRTMAAGVTS